MKAILNQKTKILTVLTAVGILLSGCDKTGPERRDAASILPVVSATKGLVMTTENINQVGETFGMQGYLDDDIATSGGAEDADKENFHFLNSSLIRLADGWEWDGVPSEGTEEEKDAYRPKWRADIASRFWSYYPLGMSAIVTDLTWPADKASDDAQKKVTFSYTLPEPASEAPFQDAENQPDLLFAFNEKSYGHGSDQYLDINFHHALAAVNFDITHMGETVDFGTEITLVNVRYSGDCEATGVPSDNSVSFVWSNLSSDFKSFSQTFDKENDFETISRGYVRQKVSGEKTFWVIPQLLTADTKLAVKFIFKDGDVPITRVMPIGEEGKAEGTDFTVWEAGKIYTYGISVDDDYSLLDLNLKVSDWVNGRQDVSF